MSIVRVLFLAFLVLVMPACVRAEAEAATDPASGFVDYSRLRLGLFEVEEIDPATIEWGRKVLRQLDIEGQPAAAKAARLVQYLHDNVAFEGFQPETVADIIAEQAGNCNAHARLGIFLLRLAGVPAKFAWESHLNMTGQGAGVVARERNHGQYGAFHNAHVWVFYHDGETWQPFDSGIGYQGYAAFPEYRWLRPPHVVAGPPFEIWEDTGLGFANMNNVTTRIWQQFELPDLANVTNSKWQAFVSGFQDLGREQSLRLPSEEVLASIETMARLYFVPVRADTSSVPEVLRPLLCRITHDRGDYLFHEYEVSSLAWELCEQGRGEDGVRLLLFVSTIQEPASLWNLWTLGRLYRTMGMREQAVATYRSMLRLDPRDARARQWLRKIGEDVQPE
jgi:hypothetical protein